MPSDGHYSHTARLGTPSYHGTTDRPLLNTVLIDDAATSGLNIERITRRVNVHSVDAERGARMGYSFPETFDDPESLERQKEVYFGLLQGSLRSGRVPWAGGAEGGGSDWGWVDEEIHTHKSHLPAPQTDDVLPSESHSSYPFGRPYLAIPGQHPRASTLKHTPRTWLSDAKAWNGIGLRGNSTSASNQQSSSNAAAAASQSSREALSKPLDALPEYLATKQSLDSIPHLTSEVSWPFGAVGPGSFNWKSILSQRQQDQRIQRALRDRTTLLEREAWYELALDELLPRGRPDVRDPLSLGHPPLDADSSTFHTKVELELAAFEAELKELYGDDDVRDGEDDEGEEEEEQDENLPHDEDEDAQQAQNSAEQKASRQLRRLLAAGSAGAARSKAGGETTGPLVGADDLMKRLVSLRLRAGAGSMTAQGQSVFLQRASE